MLVSVSLRLAEFLSCDHMLYITMLGFTEGHVFNITCVSESTCKTIYQAETFPSGITLVICVPIQSN